jgi:hypothetical protein
MNVTITNAKSFGSYELLAERRPSPLDRRTVRLRAKTEQVIAHAILCISESFLTTVMIKKKNISVLIYTWIIKSRLPPGQELNGIDKTTQINMPTTYLI